MTYFPNPHTTALDAGTTARRPTKDNKGDHAVNCERCGKKTGFNWGDASEVLCTNCFWKKEKGDETQKNPSTQTKPQTRQSKEVEKMNLD